MNVAFFSRKVLSAVVALMALSWIAPGVFGQDEPNPIAAQVKASLKDPAKPFTMVVLLQVKDGMQNKFETAFAKAVKETRKEKGYLSYDLNRDAKDGSRYMVYERWKSLADLESHLKAPYITALLGELKEMLAGPPEVKVLLPAGE
jgi:autoinducer 2-degrading protein